MLKFAMMMGLGAAKTSAIPGDLMGMIIQASQNSGAQSPASLPVKPRWAKHAVQPLFTGTGLLISGILEHLPADTALSIQDRIFGAIAAKYATPFEAIKYPLERARTAVRRAELDSGKPAALLALLSHPPAYGDAAALNVEMVRLTIAALRFLRAASCRPRMVIAVDSFALDMLAIHEEGLYTGFVSKSHLGLNRLASRQSFSAYSCLRQTASDLMPWELFSRLDAGGEVGMILSGGIPATGRALYVVREWIKESWRLRPQARLEAAVSLERLRQNEDFRDFEASLPRNSSLSKNVPRLCEGWAAACALGLRSDRAATQSACETGRLDALTTEALRGTLDAFGFGAPELDARLESAADEFSRETPFRRRFFRLLAKRVLGLAGRPLVIVPIAHGAKGPEHISCGDSWVWRAGRQGAILAHRASKQEETWQGLPEDFAEHFVSENFK